MRWQKTTYPTEYLSNYLTDLYHVFSIVRSMYGDYKTDISFKFRSSPGDVAIVTN